MWGGAGPNPEDKDKPECTAEANLAVMLNEDVLTWVNKNSDGKQKTLNDDEDDPKPGCSGLSCKPPK